MNTLKRTIWIILLAILMLVPLMVQAQMSDEEKAIAIAAGDEDLVALLEQFEDWEAEAYEEDEDIYGVDFLVPIDPEDPEFIGFVLVNVATGEIYETFVPIVLPTSVEVVLQERVLNHVSNDPEVLSRLGSPDLWEHYVEFDGFDGLWYVGFERGLEVWVAVVEVVFVDADEDNYDVQEIELYGFFDGNRLEEQEQIANNKNQAIILAYEADGIDDAVGDVEDWTTMVSQYNGSQWTVQFISGDTVLFTALVDIEQDVVLQSSTG